MSAGLGHYTLVVQIWSLSERWHYWNQPRLVIDHYSPVVAAQACLLPQYNWFNGLHMVSPKKQTSNIKWFTTSHFHGTMHTACHVIKTLQPKKNISDKRNIAQRKNGWSLFKEQIQYAVQRSAANMQCSKSAVNIAFIGTCQAIADSSSLTISTSHNIVQYPSKIFECPRKSGRS